MYDSHPLQPNSPDNVSIHAGFPNAGTDQSLHSLDLNQLLMPRPVSTFLFRIRGEQGITQGIFDGDIALVDRALTPRPHDLVLWHNGQQFNLSRPVRLQADSTVWGVITAVIHQYRKEGA